jgi:hypothetical protein
MASCCASGDARGLLDQACDSQGARDHFSAANHGSSRRGNRVMPAYRIQSHTRHKSAQVVAGYIREADK